MEITTFMRVLLRRWWLVLIPTVIAAAAVLPDLLRPTAISGSFTSIMHFTAAERPGESGSELGYEDRRYFPWLASELMMDAFTQWVKTSTFAQAVAAARPGIDPTLLSVASDNVQSVARLYLTYPDEVLMPTIWEAAEDVLKNRHTEYLPQISAQGASVMILDTYNSVPNPPPIANRFAPLLRVGLSLIGGIALALLLHYLDPFVRTRREVESLGLPVIVTLPKDPSLNV